MYVQYCTWSARIWDKVIGGSCKILVCVAVAILLTFKRPILSFHKIEDIKQYLAHVGTHSGFSSYLVTDFFALHTAYELSVIGWFVFVLKKHCMRSLIQQSKNLFKDLYSNWLGSVSVSLCSQIPEDSGDIIVGDAIKIWQKQGSLLNPLPGRGESPNMNEKSPGQSQNQAHA